MNIIQKLVVTAILFLALSIPSTSTRTGKIQWLDNSAHAKIKCFFKKCKKPPPTPKPGVFDKKHNTIINPSCKHIWMTWKWKFCGFDTGARRMAMGMRLSTDSGTLLTEVFVRINNNDVVLHPDSVITTFFATDPNYKSRLRPHDTWVGVSSTGLVNITDPATVEFMKTVEVASNDAFEDTREMVFGFVPQFYSDSSNVADSLQKSFEGLMGDQKFVDYSKNSFVTFVNGRQVVAPPPVIRSDPPGETFPPIYNPKPGDLIITEIMKDPNGSVSDATGEWFEVLNASDVFLNMSDIEIADNGSDLYAKTTDDLIAFSFLAPGQTAVFGRSGDLRLNGGAEVDVEYGNTITLANGADEIILFVPGAGIIDKVEYDAGLVWPNPSGKSMYLTDTTADNNDGSKWAVSSLSFGNAGQKGTPNSQNNVQSDTPIFPPIAITPTQGALIFTEISAQPLGDDDKGEWFEIFCASDSSIDLTNSIVEVEDSAGIVNSFTISTSVTIDPQAYLIFVRKPDNIMACLPAGYDYPDNISLSNDKGKIRLKNSIGTLVDEVSYDGNLFEGFPDFGNGMDGGWPTPSEYDGRSMSLKGSLSQLKDPNYNNNISSNWNLSSNLRRYGMIFYGSPGKPNDFDLSLSLTMSSAISVSAASTDTFSITITPQSGMTVNDIDTQSIRLFFTQKPIFLKITTSNIRADFLVSELAAEVERNVATSAIVTADRNSDSNQLFKGTAAVTFNDAALPTPGTIQTASAGDLILSEIMVNGPGDENATEYFELYNKSSKTIDLTTLGVQDGGGTTSDPTPEAKSRIYNGKGAFPIRINPGEYKVIGRHPNFVVVGKYHPDGVFLNQDLNFANSGDQAVIFRLVDNVVITQVDYSPSLGFPAQDVVASDNRSMSLVDVTRDPSQGKNWVNASIPYGDSGFGTPGSENRIAYKSGHALVSEVYANPPPGGEPNAEFFEVVNTDSRPIDLSGLIVTDDNGNTFAIDDYPGKIVGGKAQKVFVPGNSAFVFGNSRSASDGVDSTFADTFGPNITSYDYPNSWTLLNTTPGDAARLIRFFAGGSSIEIHGMTYSSAPEGKSWELDHLSDSLTYNLKTPSPTVKPPQ